MEFKKYSSIENSYRTRFIEKIEEYGYAGNTEYIVQEKAHGANVSFWNRGCAGITPAKRTSMLPWDGKDLQRFYNLGVVTNENTRELSDIFQRVVDITGADYDEIAVYGELIGGSYPHPDVEKVNQKAVQKGVYYCPEQRLYLFDIRHGGTYVDPEVSEKIFSEHNILYAKTLFRGTLQECLEYPNEYQSTIPEDLGLPPIEDNVCEGNVIKPAKALYFPNGERIIIKNKNKKFSEKQKAAKKPKVKKVIELPENVQKYMEDIAEYVNENRLRNVLSKMGPVTNKDFGKIAGSFSKDAIEDFIKDNPEFKTIDDNERKFVTKSVGRLVADTIRPNFVNIIDGAF